MLQPQKSNSFAPLSPLKKFQSLSLDVQAQNQLKGGDGDDPTGAGFIGDYDILGG